MIRNPMLSVAQQAYHMFVSHRTSTSSPPSTHASTPLHLGRCPEVAGQPLPCSVVDDLPQV